jgi:bacterioferritin-associated ferredoxin
MCGNCERLAKQVVREGRPSDKVVENFSVEKWQL